MKTVYGILIAILLPGAALVRMDARQSAPATIAQPAEQPAQLPQQRPLRVSEGDGSTIFGNFCENCHGNPKVDSAPPPAVLKQMTPESIYSTLTKGNMVTIAKGLTDQQKRDIAEWVGGRKLGAAESGDAKKMTNVCASNPPIRDLTSKPSWNGWSADLSDTRFQPAKAADLSVAQVSRLRLKWAFGLPAAASVYGQPTLVDGRVFVSSDAGFVYALDAETGCVHWSFQAQTGVRSAITVGKIKAGGGGEQERYAAFFGDIHGNIYAVDTTNGELLWKHAIDAHPLSRITGGTRLYDGRLYVPVASLEEPESSSPNHPCCTFRGMVAALDANTGRQIWKTYTIPDQPTPRKTPDGRSFIGPSGAGVWSPMTIDPKRHAIYFVTGNTFSDPDVGRSDAIMALDLDTGKILWIQQDEAKDVWHTGCPQGQGPPGFPPKTFRAGSASAPSSRRPPMPPSYYCPDPEGPDWDFSAGAILLDLPNGRSLLVAGQKSGLVWAHDPDKKGALVWRSDISRGQIVFGGAADDEKAYFAMRGGIGTTAGLAAVQLSDGLEKWFTPIPPQESMSSHAGITAGVTVIPGVVFTAGLDGMLRAFGTMDGRPLWQYDTTQEVETVNGVKARGGSIGSAGTTIAGGMVYVTSGYTGFQGGSPGNLLLAFAP
jgi:polyvinyl alcohol dehydrogenase (cytochrome)